MHSSRVRVAAALAAVLATGGAMVATPPVSARLAPLSAASTAIPGLRVSDVRVDEGAGTASFAVSISGPADASVRYSTADGTATAPGDYTSTTGTATFSAAGPTTQVVSVPVANDANREAFETFSLRLDSPSTGAVVSDNTGTASVVDDDGLPAQLSVRDVASVAEGTSAVFRLAVEGTLDQAAAVTYTTVKGTAAAPGDFKSTTGSLTLQPGVNPSTSVSVPVGNDAVSEGNETFSLKVTAATNMTVADAVGTAVIAASDGGSGSPSLAPRLAVGDVRVSEAGGAATFTVSLTSAATATVKYATPSTLATAVAPRDYSGQSGTLSFSASGATTATVTVPVVNDESKEFFEVVRLKLSSPTGAVIADSLGTATIVDDDGLPPQLVVADVDQPVAEGATADFVVSLEGTPDEPVTASVATVPGTAGTSDYGSPTPATVSFPAGTANPSAVVSVPVTSDTLAEAAETFSLKVTSAANADLADTVGAATIAGTVSADPVIAAAGDIACGPDDSEFNSGAGTATNCRQGATSDLLVGSGLTAVLTLGDNQYTAGTLAAFQASYDPSWGRALAMTRPAVGNHEYGTAGAAGYFDYFGSAAGDRARGYYSFDVGAWHLVALNSQCSAVGGCGPGSPQEQWLVTDLEANPAKCTLAYWHHPRFSSGEHGNNATYDAFWRALYAAGADVVLNGHDHDYERFGPQRPDATADTGAGIRQYVVGTGGSRHYSFTTVRPNSEIRNGDTFGVLRLTLRADSYDWEFAPEAGKTFTDSGSTACH